MASTLPQLKQPRDSAMQAPARPGVPPDEVEVEVEVEIEIDDGRCEKEEQRSGLAINVGEICAGIVNGAG